MINAIEEPANPVDGNIVEVKLLHRTPSEILPLVRPFLGIAENVNATADGSLRFTVDELGSRLLVTGKPDKIENLQKVLKLLDINEPAGNAFSEDAPEQPQFEIYTIVGADPQTALNVIGTMLAGQPNVRLAIDPKTNNLYALATPSVRRMIRATLDQMQKDKREIVVIKLRRIILSSWC